jgi:two-component system, cell cycle sensor histidine kinase and response regulator CckA
MKEERKTNTQRLEELTALRRRVEELTVKEAGLAKSEERYRNFVSDIEDGCFESDLEGQLTFCNEAFLKIFGLTRERLKEVSRWDRHKSSEDAKRIFRMYVEMYRQNIPFRILEYEIRRGDGEIRSFEASVSLIRDQEGKTAGFRGICRDITERKKIEAEQNQYRTFIENIDDGCFEADLKGNITFYNEATLRILGRPGVPRLNYKTYTTPEEAEKLKNIYNQMYRTGEPVKNYYYEIVRKDGEIRVIEGSAGLIRDAQGAPVGFRGVLRDVTERNKLEAEQKRYRTFIESIEDGCFETDLKGYITFDNEAARRIFGYSAEELHRLNYKTYTTPEGAEKVKNIYNHIYRTGEPVKMYDHQIVRKDGELRILEGSAALLRDTSGKPTGFISTFRDVTERKKIEAEQERYRNFVENVEDGCFEYDLRGRCIFCNEATGRSLGYTREEYMRLHMRERHGSAEDAQRVFDIYSKVYKTGIPEKRYSFHLLHKDGTTGIHEASISLIRDAAGRPTGFRGVARDITEQKRLEEEQGRLRDQLYQSQKMEAVGTLAGGIAHDFNNILMGIQGYTSLMLLDIDSSHSHYDRLKTIESQIQSGADLTRQLLGYARGGRYEIKPTNLNELIDKAASMFGRTKKEIRIHKSLALDLKNVEIDPGQIEQVLLNLFINAWQAMPGGGNIYLETGNVILDEFYLKPYDVKPGLYVKLSVTDTGVGMDEKIKARIFEPFFTTKEMGRGTGLGLASTYGIIKGHKGLINVYSEKGHGTTFNVYLPASGKRTTSQDKSLRLIVRGHETILIVDDEKIIADVTGEMLAGLGYRFITAASGEEAVDIYRARTGEIDLVIMDMIMPGIGGGAAFDAIKVIKPEAKVILASGYSMNGDAKDIMKRGVKAFLQKPFLIEELAQKIRDVLDT